MKRYLYDGPVKEYGTCVNSRWRGETMAPSEKKARSNLAYQYKKRFGKVVNTRIVLPGKLVVTDK